MLLVVMMCASSVCLLCIPFILICMILRSYLLCCVDFGFWWLVADVVWGGLDVGELVAGAICAWCSGCRWSGCGTYLVCGGSGCTGF